jgi:hypothetical protein
MDKELEEAQSLTREDLIEKLEHGRPAKLAHGPALRDPNHQPRRVVDQLIRMVRFRRST